MRAPEPATISGKPSNTRSAFASGLPLRPPVMSEAEAKGVPVSNAASSAPDGRASNASVGGLASVPEGLVTAVVHLVDTGPVLLGAYTIAELTAVDAIVDFLETRPSDEGLAEAIRPAQVRTKDYDAYRFNLAVAYGGRQEILTAIRDVVRDAQAGKVQPEDIDEKFFSRRLYTADLPDPDLVLRTSGEERISNFLLWQLAYAELYFVDVYWPGFRKIDFLRAIRSYQMRTRRYGA